MATGQKIKGSLVHLTQQGDNSRLEEQVMQQIQLWLFLFKYGMIQDPTHILNTLEKHLMAFKHKRFPIFWVPELTS